MKRYRLVIISDSLRRDFQNPLKFFRHLEIIHLYRQANYGDMTGKDFVGTEQVNGFFALYQALKRLDPDIIAAPEPYQGFSRFTLISTKIMRLWLPAVFFARQYNRLLFFHALENILDRQRYSWFYPFARLIMRWYANNCRFIFFLNRGAKKNLLSAGVPLSKLKFMLWGNWGVDTQEFRLGKKTKDPTILFVGRLERIKGLSELTAAFVKLKREYPKSQLWIVGTGSLSLDSIPGIKLFGNIPNHQLPTFFQQAWLTSVPAISTSIWAEQVGMVNLQSLACGTPVVTTKSGAIPEFINKKVGLLVAEKDVNGLFMAMKKIIDSPKLRYRLGIAARKMSLERYDANKNIAKIEKFLLEQLEQFRA